MPAHHSSRSDPRRSTSLASSFVRLFLPRLHRWAHGRLPRWARGAADTADIIQDALVRTLKRLDSIDLAGPDALAAYLHEAVRNRIRDEHRQFARRGPSARVSDAMADSRPSPLDAAIAGERQRRYRAALERLDARDQELLVAHLELGYSHHQLGHMTGRTPNAARMALHRAVDRLAAKMHEG
ncbi:MAG TPA: sigma-70 family RNA polymerase sigma factor [Vicinamibacterales bacterium]|jgi:RNA polymerase sigma-70 factor (ECF subfamily)